MSKQLHEKQQDLDLDVQNKHFVEAPDNTVRYITTEQLLGGLRMFDYAITRNLQVGVDPTSFTHYDTTDGVGSNLVNRVYMNGNTVYAATEGGLSISTDGGLTYTNYTTADGLGSNAVNDVVSAGSYVYAATDAGLSISSNSGVTYTNYTTANGLLNNQCNFVYYYNGTLYVATSSGVSKTIDNTTFTTVTSSYTGQMHVDGSVFYIAVNSAFSGGGLNKSTDGGVTWSFVNSAGGSTEAHRSVFCSGANVYATYYIASAGTFTRWITISTDSGVTWTRKQIGIAESNFINLNYIFVNSGKIYVTEQNGTLLNNGALYVSSDGGVNYTSYDTTSGMGSDSLTSVFVLNGKCFVSSYQTSVGGVSKSASTWQRIRAGSGTLTEHDIATNSIDDYATASGAAGSTATLTQIMRKTISLITSYLKFFISNTTDATSSTDANASFRTSGGAAIAKKAYIGTDLNVGGLINGNTISSTNGLDGWGATSHTTVSNWDSEFASTRQFYAVSGTTNEPGAYNLVGMTLIQANTSNGIQMAYRVGADAIWFRRNNGGTKSSWVELMLKSGGTFTGNIYMSAAPTEWMADTFTGFGSTDTAIPYFTSVRRNNILNSDITVTNNATNGCKILINTAGLYSISFAWVGDSGGAGTSGISWNSSQLTTNIANINAADRLTFARAGIIAADYDANTTSITKWLSANDVIRPHTNAATPANSAQCHFSIVKIL